MLEEGAESLPVDGAEARDVRMITLHEQVTLRVKVGAKRRTAQQALVLVGRASGHFAQLNVRQGAVDARQEVEEASMPAAPQSFKTATTPIRPTRTKIVEWS